MNDLKALHEYRKTPMKDATTTLIQKLVCREKPMRKRLVDISHTVLECNLQENWEQDASWINIMLTFRGKLQQVPLIRNSMLVGQDGLVSYMFSGFV